MQHFKFVNCRIRFLMSRTGYIWVSMNLFSLLLKKIILPYFAIFFSGWFFMSFVAHRFGSIEFRKFVVVSAGTVEKIKTNIQNSTHPNQRAAKDIKWIMGKCTNINLLAENLAKLSWIITYLKIVFCCIAAWIQPDISGCQQDFLVVWRWNQLRTF